MSNRHDDHDNMSILRQIASKRGELSLTPLQCVFDTYEEHRQIVHSLGPHGKFPPNCARSSPPHPEGKHKNREVFTSLSETSL